MEFHDVLLLVAVILVVLIVVGGFVMWSVLRAFRFSELSRDMNYVKTLMSNHISKQEEQEEIQRKAIKAIEDGINGVYKAREEDKVYQQHMSNQVRQKLGIERRTAQRQRRELDEDKAPNPPKE